MLGVNLRERIRNTEIRKRTGVTDIVEHIATAKWGWAGHVARMNDNRWRVRATEWQVKKPKRRPNGRPRQSWRDDLTKSLGATSSRKARDKRSWRTLMEVYLQQWRDTV